MRQYRAWANERRAECDAAFAKTLTVANTLATPPLLQSRKRNRSVDSSSATASAVGSASRRAAECERAERCCGAMSSRGRLGLIPVSSYADLVATAKRNLYHAESNPDGWLCLAVAEQRFALDALADKLQATAPRLTPGTAGYNSWQGLPEFRSQLARMMGSTAVVDTPLNPDCLVVSTGMNALLSHVSSCLCDPGDGIIIPAPYYTAYAADVGYITQAHMVPAPLTAPAYTLTREALECAYLDAAVKDVRVRMVILSNPVNPLGTCLTEEELATTIEFCVDNNIHLMTDEIYMHSIHSGGRFVSAVDAAARLVKRKADPKFTASCKLLVHTAWGLGKGFGVCGYRIGFLHTEHEKMRQALKSFTMFSCVPFPVQAQLAEVLADDEFVSNYLTTCQNGLTAACRATRDCLDKHGVSYKPATGGMFLWTDLRPWLRKLIARGKGYTDEDADKLAALELTWDHERTFLRTLAAEARVVIVPGEATGAPEPGFFRVAFSWHETSAVVVGLERLARYLKHGALDVDD